MKIDRQAVYAKCDGHCAYCGREITFKQMQVDHMFPKSLDHVYHFETGKDVNCAENLMPACRRCNIWKHSLRLEHFRSEIQEQVNRVKLRSPNFRMALDFGQLQITESPIVFYFERVRGV